VINRLVPGGAERVLIALCGRLDRRRWRPAVICLQEPGSWASRLPDAVPIEHGVIRFKYDPRIPLRLADVARRLQAAALVSIGSNGDRMFWTMLASRLAGIPSLVWSHTFPRLHDGDIERCNLLIAPQASAYVALSEVHRRALAKVLAVDRERIAVVHNGIEPPRENPETLRAAARAQLDLDDATLAVGMVANLRPVKRIDRFVEAARLVLQKKLNVTFFLIGDGPQRQWLLDALEASEHPGGFRWLGRRDDAPRLVWGFDIAMLTSASEAFSLFMLEAMAAGCAFVAPAEAAVPEVLEHMRTGVVAASAEPQSFAECIVRLAEDPALRERLGRAAQERVRAGFTVEHMTANFTDVLEQVCR